MVGIWGLLIALWCIWLVDLILAEIRLPTSPNIGTVLHSCPQAPDVLNFSLNEKKISLKKSLKRQVFFSLREKFKTSGACVLVLKLVVCCGKC